MEVGIDGGCWANRRGYGRFLRELLGALAQAEEGIRYTLFLDSQGLEEFEPPRPVRAVRVNTSASIAVSAAAGRRRTLGDLARMSAAVARHKFDLFFFPSVYSYFPLVRPVPMLLGIHDTIADRRPEFAFASKREARFWNWKLKLALLQAQKILTVSRYSRRCIQDQFGLSAGRIRVVHEAAPPGFGPSPVPASGSPYVLYVGGISPNKNLRSLVRAYARLDDLHGRCRLVIAGDYQGDAFKSCYPELKAEVESLQIASKVEFAGYVPEVQLRDLYAGASLFAFPSLDEGFGLPVLEAMACGVPVVASRGHGVEEVAGGAAVLVEALDEEALASAMRAILTDPQTANELRRRSLNRAAQFSWERAAKQLIAIFRETAGGR